VPDVPNRARTSAASLAVEPTTPTAPSRPPGEGALGARVERQLDGGWRVTIPVRTERVRAERLTVVREEVVLRPRLVAGVERVEGTAAREEPRVDVRGDLEATQPIVER
jgi:stress response protein YsnF